MKLLGICVTRNEADIIGFCLQHASQYLDRIFVLDNGSTDDTWKIVTKYSKSNDVIVPFERKDCLFGDGLRAYIYDSVRGDYQEDDWFMILDSDEFVEESPKRKIQNCSKEKVDVIAAMQAHFYIVNSDTRESWFLNGESVDSFNKLPKHYRINNKEIRIFRNRNDLIWPIYKDNSDSFSNKLLPLNLNTRKMKMIINRHYQYRSKKQIEKRIIHRSNLYNETGMFIHHKNLKGLVSYVKNEKGLNCLDERNKVFCSMNDIVNVEMYCLRKKIKRWFKRRMNNNCMKN